MKTTAGAINKTEQRSAIGAATKGRLYFLDGLRGYGAIMVLLSHLIPGFFMSEQLTMRHPELRFITDGALAVYVFFIISGFALTESLVKADGARSLWGLVYKRYIRLAVPVFAAVLIAYLLLEFGLMHNRGQETSEWLQAFYKMKPNPFRAIFDGVFGVIFIKSTKYDPVLWSIRPEFFCSVALYMVYFKRQFLMRWGRSVFWVAAALAWGTSLVFAPLWCCFFTGVGFSHLERHRAPFEGKWLNAIGLVLFSGAIAASSWWGFRAYYADKAVPAVLALVLFVGVWNSSLLRRFFALPIARFLGEISFPLYLIHLPLVCSIGPVIYQLAKSGRFDPFGGVIPTTIVCVFSVCVVAGWAFMFLEKFLLKKAYHYCIPSKATQPGAVAVMGDIKPVIAVNSAP